MACISDTQSFLATFVVCCHGSFICLVVVSSFKMAVTGFLKNRYCMDINRNSNIALVGDWKSARGDNHLGQWFSTLLFPLNFLITLWVVLEKNNNS